MFKSRYLTFLALAALALSMMTAPVSAQEVSIDAAAQFCFSSDDFSALTEDEGIFITAVPSAYIATVCYGDRILKAGDALPKDALNQLTLHTECITEQSASVQYYTVSNGKASAAKELKLSIHPKKNDPPTAADSSFETYKNIVNSGTLNVTDPENGALTYNLIDEPKRGTVELHEDGTFTYTPKENKVGNDRFTFSVTDDAGNTSEPATVSIKIKKPTDKETYADMSGDPEAFEAMWLKEEGIFSGSAIGGNLCFSPEQTVGRGEFLVMVMNLVDAAASTQQMSSGFADEASTPAWMQPYVVAALSNGMISGTSSEAGIVFRPVDAMTKAEAAVMVQNILQLPAEDDTAVFSRSSASSIPVWAAEASASLSMAGIDLDIASETDVLTRRDAAQLLYRIGQLMEEEAVSAFYWAQ